MSAAVVGVKEQQHHQEMDQHVQGTHVPKLIQGEAEVVALEVVEPALKNVGTSCPEIHGDPALWEKCNDRSKLNWETCESDVDYLGAALRQVRDPMC